MKYEIIHTTKFKKDFKKMEKQGKDLRRLRIVIGKLANGEKLDEKYRDHALTGNYADCRECHIAPDWLLIYRVEETEVVLLLMRTGSHSELF